MAAFGIALLASKRCSKRIPIWNQGRKSPGYAGFPRSGRKVLSPLPYMWRHGCLRNRLAGIQEMLETHPDMEPGSKITRLRRVSEIGSQGPEPTPIHVAPWLPSESPCWHPRDARNASRYGTRVENHPVTPGFRDRVARS